MESSADDSGWANLATVGNKIVNQAPEFDSRNYGYAKLGELIDATQLFDIDVRTIGKEGHKVTYIKDKRK